MLIPSTFYGLYREVKPKCRKIVTKLKRGATWEEVFAEDTLLDTQLYPDSGIITDGPFPNYGFEPHFHCYVLHREIYYTITHQGKMSPDRYTDIFIASLEMPWSLLGLFDPQLSTQWFREFPGRSLSEDRISRFFSACLEFWDVFDAEGKRYDANETTIWSHQSNFTLFLKAAIELQELSTDCFALYPSNCNARISKEKLKKIVKIALPGVHLLCLKSAEW